MRAGEQAEAAAPFYGFGHGASDEALVGAEGKCELALTIGDVADGDVGVQGEGGFAVAGAAGAQRDGRLGAGWFVASDADQEVVGL